MKSKKLDVPDFNGHTISSIDIYQHTMYVFFEDDRFVMLRAEKPDRSLASVDSVVLAHTLIGHEIVEGYTESNDMELLLRFHTVGGIGYVSFAGKDLKLIIDYSTSFKQ